MQESTPCSLSVPTPIPNLSLAIKEATWSRFQFAYRKKFKKDYDPSLFIVLASIAIVNLDEQTF